MGQKQCSFNIERCPYLESHFSGVQLHLILQLDCVQVVTVLIAELSIIINTPATN